MKKIILPLVVLFGSISGVFAQEQVTLNVKLNPIQTLVVNNAQTNVDLEYKTVEDYAQGVSSLQKDHLKVFSTGGYAVSVKSDQDEITRQNGAETISASSIQVIASKGETNPADANFGSIALSTSPADNLISSAIGGVDMNFNIEYKGLGANGFVNKYYNDENPTVYTTTVTYSIIAQ